MARLDLLSRPRRNRKSAAIRDAVRETWLGPEHFIYPLFIHEGLEDIPIGSMPGRARLSPAGLLREVERAMEHGIRSLVLFPAIDESLKSSEGAEAHNEAGLIPRTISALKQRWPELVVVTSPITITKPVLTAVSQATRPVGSCSSTASRNASLIWSHILSGCPSVTDSDVNSKRGAVIKVVLMII